MEQPTAVGADPSPPRAHASRGLGFVAIAGAAAMWAVGATVASSLFSSGVEPLELVQARAVVASLGLALIPAVWRRGSPARLLLWHVIGLGLSIAAVNATYYLAIDRLEVAVAVVLQYTAPALVVAWVALRARRAPDRVILVAVAAAIAGVVLASELPGRDLGSLNVVGISLGLASAVLFATYTLLSQRVAEVYGALGALARAFPVAAAVWIAYQLPRGVPSALFTADNLPRVLVVGLVGTLFPFMLYLWGIAQVQAERAAIAATLEPVLAAAIAWIWLGQELSLMQLSGGALVVGAVVILQAASRGPTRAPEP